jgi:hypothetical protein
LKKSPVDARQGGKRRKSAVYLRVHERFEQATFKLFATSSRASKARKRQALEKLALANAADE